MSLTPRPARTHAAWHRFPARRPRGRARRSFFFFFNDTATTEIYTLSLHDALPISSSHASFQNACMNFTASTVAEPSSTTFLPVRLGHGGGRERSEEHTSELQSPCNLVCRLLLEKKKKPPHDSTYVANSTTSPHARSLASLSSAAAAGTCSAFFLFFF